MKILFFTHYTALFGANRSLIALAHQLQIKSYKVIVLLPTQGPLCKELEIRNIPYIIEEFYDEFYYKRGFSRLLGLKRHIENRLNIGKILKVVNSIKPDIIHSNSSALQIGAKVAYKLNIPHVWHIREFGLQDYKAAYNMGLKNHLKWLNRSAHIISISEALKNEVLSAVKAPISIIYNGVMSEESMRKLPKQFRQSEKAVFALVASFRSEKGHKDALDAFIDVADKLPKAELLLVGDCDNAFGNQLKEKVNQSGLTSRVKFPGFIDNPDEIYGEIDVLLMCSKSEAMGRVTAEAFAHSKPVIAFNGGANPELIENGIDGFLYANPQGLIDAMLKLGSDAELRLKIGEKGYQKALSLFTEEIYASKVEKVYKQVLKY
ncbi:glycosyltransferase family 4 protein [Chondrinema litorale]|uniref:glycosyltransferase family 4 protein n=1 Tax=Chondrinema litorale TaxID=2994555 RepID=UPI0025427CC6|nr:glycosyltransferase family 4 protein [Chondrinema litorale]UZR94234.1 glycosyltransferase family 4 protein [Chondrinema litorale]